MSEAQCIHLDTNVLIFGLLPEHPIHGQLFERNRQGEVFAASAMAWSEFHCGPVSSHQIAAWETLLAGGVLPIDRAVSERAAALFNQTGRRSRTLPDCIVAATAISHGAPLVTLNRTDFERFLPYGLVLA